MFVLIIFVIERIKLVAVQNFDPSEMTLREQKEIVGVLTLYDIQKEDDFEKFVSLQSELESGSESELIGEFESKSGSESTGASESRSNSEFTGELESEFESESKEEMVSDPSDASLDSEDECYMSTLLALAFEKGDKMETIPSEVIR